MQAVTIACAQTHLVRGHTLARLHESSAKRRITMKRKEYLGQDITVTFDMSKCIHA